MNSMRILILFLLASRLVLPLSFAQDANDAGAGAAAANASSSGGGAADTSHEVDTPRTDRKYDARKKSRPMAGKTPAQTTHAGSDGGNASLNSSAH